MSHQPAEGSSAIGANAAVEVALGARGAGAAWIRSGGVVLFAGLGVAGGGFMVAKGAIRATLGDDLSFAPAALFFTGFGVWALAETVAATRRFRWAAIAGRGLAGLSVASGLVALLYLLARTIPETDGAPAAVAASYGVAAASIYLGQLILGIAAVRSEALPGRLRWAPMGVVILQFPVFIVAGAIGDGIGDETVTDGLGMALTGLLWVGSSAAVWSSARRRQPDTGMGIATEVEATHEP